MLDSNVICTMSGMKYRAGFACYPKKDVRYYLNGLHISADNAEVVATDGSILYVADVELGQAAKDIIFEPAKIPTNIETVTISVFNPGVDDHNVLIQCLDSRGNTSQHICKLIEGSYPNYRNILNAKNADTQFNKIGWSSKYLAMLKTIFGNKPLSFEIANQNCASVISDTTDYSNGRVILMPCRV